MDHPHITLRLLEKIYDLSKFTVLTFRRSPVSRRMEVGIDAGGMNVGVLSLPVEAQQPFHVEPVRAVAIPAHPRVQLQMDVRHHVQPLRRPLQGEVVLPTAQGERHPQLQQLFPLLGIGRAPQHQDRILRETRLPEGPCLSQAGNGQVIHAAVIQNPGQRDNAQAVAVALDHAPNHLGQIPKDPDVILQIRPLHNVFRFHKTFPSLCLKSARSPPRERRPRSREGQLSFGASGALSRFSRRYLRTLRC